jgi:hypothetical protein
VKDFSIGCVIAIYKMHLYVDNQCELNLPKQLKFGSPRRRWLHSNQYPLVTGVPDCRFGPQLLGFTDGDGIRYSLRALPLGGYVSFPEGGAPSADTSDASEEAGGTGAAASARSRRGKDQEEDGEEEEVIPEDDPDLLQNRPAIQVRRSLLGAPANCTQSLAPLPPSLPLFSCLSVCLSGSSPYLSASSSSHPPVRPFVVLSLSVPVSLHISLPPSLPPSLSLRFSILALSAYLSQSDHCSDGDGDSSRTLTADLHPQSDHDTDFILKAITNDFILT